MSKRKDGYARGKYTLEFKMEAVRLVKGGQAVPVTAKILGVPTQTLGNWVRLSNKGQLKGAVATSRCLRSRWNWPDYAQRTLDFAWSVTFWEKLRRTSPRSHCEVRVAWQT